jgi:hypothetical protein
VTAKEKLRERIEGLSDEQAERLLDLFEDPVVAAFRDAPLDDEPWTEADEAAMAEVEADRAAGVPTIPLEGLKRELDGE